MVNDEIFSRVSSLCDDFRVIKAYPFAYKPTHMQMTTVAVSPMGEKSRLVGLGGYAQQSDCDILLSVFVPYEKGIDEMSRVVDILRDGLLDDSVLSLEIGKVDSSKSMDTISVNMVVRYSEFTEKNNGK